MSLDQIITALVYLAAVFFVFIIGKFVFDKINRRFDLKHELLQNDNFALALTVVGYYSGLIFALGGVLYGDSAGLVNDLIDIVLYGLMAIILLNLSGIINDKIVLHTFDNTKEIIDDRNAGTGAIEGANYLASGLMISGAISGEGDVVTALAFWALGQAAIVVGSKIYNLITPFDVHAEVEKDNVAVGVAFAGVLVAIGNVVRVGVSGDFVSWSENLAVFIVVVVFGFILLPVVRYITDKMLLPGEKLTDELINQETPNVGAGAIEAFSYVAASFLIGWVI